MALGLVPLLALFGGAVVIAGGKKKKAAPKARACSPQELFGATGDYGGYTLDASQFVKHWISQNPNSGTAALIARDERHSAPFIEAFKEVDKSFKAGKLEAYDQFDKVCKDFGKLMESVFRDSQTAADEILSDIGCQQSKMVDVRVSSIISNDSHWTKLLIWSGVLANLKSSVGYMYPMGLEDTDEQNIAFFSADLLIRRILGFKHKNILKYPSNKNDGTKFAEKIKTLTRVSQSTIAEIRGELRGVSASNEKWLFGPLEGGAKPWTELEKSYISVVEDVNFFFTGSREIPTDDWNVSDLGMDRGYLVPDTAFEWWSYSVIGSAFKSQGEAELAHSMFFGISQVDGVGGFYPEALSPWMADSGLSPIDGIRTRYKWWENSGVKVVDALLASNPDLSGDIEGLAIAALSPWIYTSDTDIAKNKSGEPYIKRLGGSDELQSSGDWLLNNFPRYSTYGTTWALGPTFDYWDEVKRFSQEHPLAFYAILNVMMLIGNKLGIDVSDYLHETE